MCMCVLMSGGAHKHAIVRMWSWETWSVIPGQLSNLTARGKVSRYSPLDLPGQRAHKLPVILQVPLHVSPLGCQYVTGMRYRVWLCIGPGDTNSGPQAYTTSTVPTERQPYPRCRDLCKSIFLCARCFLIFVMNTCIHTFICK